MGVITFDNNLENNSASSINIPNLDLNRKTNALGNMYSPLRNMLKEYVSKEAKHVEFEAKVDSEAINNSFKSYEFEFMFDQAKLYVDDFKTLLASKNPRRHEKIEKIVDDETLWASNNPRVIKALADSEIMKAEARMKARIIRGKAKLKRECSIFLSAFLKAWIIFSCSLIFIYFFLLTPNVLVISVILIYFIFRNSCV